MTGTKSKNRLAEVLTHLTCWGLILGFPFLFVIDQDESIVDWQEYGKRATVILCYSIVFYINYFSLGAGKEASRTALPEKVRLEVRDFRRREDLFIRTQDNHRIKLQTVMILKCAIMDDEPLALGLMESYVEKTPFLTLAGRYSSAVAAMEKLQNRVHDRFQPICN